MATPSVAHVTATPLAGLALPAPCIVTLTIEDAETGELMDVANAQIRRKDPAGRFVTLSIERTSLGTYVAGSTDLPIFQTKIGAWAFEGRSSLASDLVEPDTDEIIVYSDGFPMAAVPGLESPSGQATLLSHRVTQAEIDADVPVQVAALFVPSGATAMVAGGTNVSDLASCDGVNAYVLLAMSDGVNPSPFVDGDIVIITAVE